VADKSAKITFRHGAGARGADFLNGYVDQIISGTASEMIGDGIATLQALKADREHELERFRRQRDIALKQTVARYDDALNTATAAGIERPIMANLGSTAAIVAGIASPALLLWRHNSEIRNQEPGNPYR
jgi:LPS O-antigen subunit length determinant protein (WzzB/FepE family)